MNLKKLTILLLLVIHSNIFYAQYYKFTDTVGICILQKEINLFEEENFMELKREPAIQTKQILIYGYIESTNTIKVINILDGKSYFTLKNLMDKSCNLRFDSTIRIWNALPTMLENERFNKADEFAKIILKEKELKKNYENAKELVAIYENGKKYKLVLSEFNVTGSDYTIGMDITVENTHRTKTIKYIYFNVIIKNPVEDIIATKTVTGIGPIEPNSKSKYTFEDILFSKIASYLTIKSIKIQYMDGSVLILNRSILDKIELSDELNELNNNLN